MGPPPHPSIRLLHWHPAEAAERGARLAALGFAVDASPLDGMAGLRALGDKPPDAVVIDLGRLPSNGRAIAVALRKRKATRHLPLLFVGGAPDKVARAREVLPDAVFTTWERIDTDLRAALTDPPEVRVVPASIMDAWAGTPLPTKLGVEERSRLVLLDAPDGFEGTLGCLPLGAVVSRERHGPRAVTLWFVRQRGALERDLAGVAAEAHPGWLWIAWPKKGTGVPTDLVQQTVREVGLAAGLVDSKVCRVDDTWAALRFSRRKQRRSGRLTPS
jgi:hypothetical protein